MSEEEKAKRMQRAGKEWAASRDIIAKAVFDLVPLIPYDRSETVAALILARLARHQPPILTIFATEEE